MLVSSNCFRHKEIHKQTRRSPDGKNNYQTDHILTDERKASNMLDVKLCRVASGDCDRCSVRGRYRCKIAYSKYEPNGTAGRLRVDGL
jgi:predicted nucleic-acid-binding Zn-ribbon protein